MIGELGFIIRRKAIAIVDLGGNDVVGILPMTKGGTNKNLTAVAGGIVWTDADSMEVSAAGSQGALLISGGTGAPTWTAVGAAGQFLVSGGTGAPTWLATPLPIASGGTNATSYNTGEIPYFDGTRLTGNSLFNFSSAILFGLGVSSPQNAIHVDRGNATAAAIQFTAGTTTGQTSGDGFHVGITSAAIAEIRQRENLAMNFLTNDTQRMSIAAGGQVGVGASAANAQAIFDVVSTLLQSRPMPSMTTTERDALTAITGGMIFNTTTGRPEYYDGTVWQAGDGSMVVFSSVQSVTAAGTITASRNRRQTRIVIGSGGPITVDTTTGITAGVYDGQELRLIGNSNINTVSLATAGNVFLNGGITLGAGDILDLHWDGTNSLWREVSRSE